MKIRGINYVVVHLWPQRYSLQDKDKSRSDNLGDTTRVREIRHILHETLLNPRFADETYWVAGRFQLVVACRQHPLQSAARLWGSPPCPPLLSMRCSCAFPSRSVCPEREPQPQTNRRITGNGALPTVTRRLSGICSTPISIG